jgi:hypothetical protein
MKRSPLVRLAARVHGWKNAPKDLAVTFDEHVAAHDLVLEEGLCSRP